MQLHTLQADVSSAFLQSSLDDYKFYQLPKGHPKYGSGLIWKSKKAVYGLREAPLAWSKELTSFLLTEGFNQCEHEKALFSSRKDGKLMIVCCYVDDLLFAAERSEDLVELKLKFESKYKIKFTPDIEKFVGFQIKKIYKSGGEFKLELSAEDYITKLEQNLEVLSDRLEQVPITKSCDVTQNGTVLSDRSVYQAVVGSLLYAAILLRPDIAYAVNVWSRLAQKPTKENLIGAKKVAQYLKSTKELKMHYEKSGSISMRGYTDASHGDKPSRQSVSGFVIFLAGNPICYKVKKQAEVSLSTCESEIIGLSYLISHMLWIENILRFLGVKLLEVDAFVDNIAAMKLFKGESNPQRVKHIDIRYLFTRSVLKRNKIWRLLHVRSEDNVADIFTKPLEAKSFLKLRKMLKLRPGDAPKQN